MASYLERGRKSKDQPDVLTEEKLIELLKKGDNEEIVRILTAESPALSDCTDKGIAKDEVLTTQISSRHTIF